MNWKKLTLEKNENNAHRDKSYIEWLNASLVSHINLATDFTTPYVLKTIACKKWCFQFLADYFVTCLWNKLSKHALVSTLNIAS